MFTFSKTSREAIDNQLLRVYLLNRTQSTSLLCVDYHFWFIRQETSWCILVIWHSSTWFIVQTHGQAAFMVRGGTRLVISRYVRAHLVYENAFSLK